MWSCRSKSTKITSAGGLRLIRFDLLRLQVLMFPCEAFLRGTYCSPGRTNPSCQSLSRPPLDTANAATEQPSGIPSTSSVAHPSVVDTHSHGEATASSTKVLMRPRLQIQQPLHRTGSIMPRSHAVRRPRIQRRTRHRTSSLSVQRRPMPSVAALRCAMSSKR